MKNKGWGVLLILAKILDRLCSISRLISTLTGKSLFTINSYQLTLSITLPSYRPPYRKIQINPYHLSSHPLKNSTKNHTKITHPSIPIQINSSHQSIPFSYTNFPQYPIHHSPHQNLNVFLA